MKSNFCLGLANMPLRPLVGPLLVGPPLRKTGVGLLLAARHERLNQGTKRFQIRTRQRPHLPVVHNRVHIFFIFGLVLPGLCAQARPGGLCSGIDARLRTVGFFTSFNNN